MSGRNKVFFLLVLLCLSSINDPTHTHAAVGDTWTEAQTAIVGNNTATLSANGDIFYFTFTTELYNYEFLLFKPDGTDFTYSIYAANGTLLDYGGDQFRRLLKGDGSQVVIVIYANSGPGTITLSIGYGPSESSYYSGLITGDTCYWNTTQRVNGTPSTLDTYAPPFHNGMSTRISILKDAPTIDPLFSSFDNFISFDYEKYNTPNTWTTFPNGRYFLFFFILPINSVFGPSGTRNIEEFLNWWVESKWGASTTNFQITLNNDLLTYHLDEGNTILDAVYNATTGIMKYLQIEGTADSKEHVVITMKEFNPNAPPIASLNKGTLELVDSNYDGNEETIIVTNIDPNLPGSSADDVDLFATLFFENGTEVVKIHEIHTVLFDIVDSLTIDFGKVPISGNYSYSLEVYNSDPMFRDDGYTSDKFYVEADGNWTAYIQNIDYEVYDGNGDNINESVRIINFDPNLTNGTDEVTIWVNIVNSEGIRINEININPTITKDDVDSITIDFGAMQLTDTYTIYVDIYYASPVKPDDAYVSLPFSVDLNPNTNTNTNTDTSINSGNSKDNGDSKTNPNLSLFGPNLDIIFILVVLAIPIRNKREISK